MKKHSIITLAFILCLSMLFHTSAVAIDTLVPDTVYWEDKIDESVYESPIYENGKRLVYIQRESISQDVIAENLQQKYNYSMDVYENELAYKEQILPVITDRVTAELGETAAYSTAEQLQLTGESLTPIDLAVSEDYDNYIMAKRATCEELYSATNNKFLEDKIENVDDILYQGSYHSDFILYATDAEIEKYAKCPTVISIGAFYEEIQVANSLPIEQTQIGVDSTSGTKSSLFNSGSGYKGTGIKIGIIEAEEGRYDPDAPQLKDIDDVRLSYEGSISGTGVISYHATMVTSLIAGQAYTVDGCTYEGVVPQATVYQFSITTSTEVLEAVEKLIELNVSVINYSGGANDSSLEYNYYDQKIDDLTYEYGITFVGSAGNNGALTNHNITSPAKSANAIVVGNAFTKDSNCNALLSPFDINESSSYAEAETVDNRPDIVAPGTNIAIPLSEDTIKISSGTSFSAPLVTGIVAQLHQANPYLKTDSTGTKSIIMAGAVPEVISTDDNPVVAGEYLRDKSGAGMVNAINSMNIVLDESFITQEITIQYESNTNTSINNIIPIYTPAGEKVRIFMVYSKRDPLKLYTDAYGNDLNLSITNFSTGEVIASSNELYNHVEVIEYTAEKSGYVYANVSLVNIDTHYDPYALKYSIAWAYPD